MTRPHIELVREGNLLAEVPVTLIEDATPESGWGPYLSLADAQRIERVRLALRRSDVQAASQEGTIYRVMPVTAA